MMSLWKETFHDDDKYIEMVFSNYFDMDNVAYVEDNGEIVSALLGVPYKFCCRQHEIEGLYLCGLATKSEYRRHGIMDNLLHEINERARNRYAFTFLIPADASLSRYYHDRGYENAMFNVLERYTSIHDFIKDYSVILSREDERVSKLKTKYCDTMRVEKLDSSDKNTVEKLSEFIVNSEHSTPYLCLSHSLKDLAAVIEDNTISGGKIFYTVNRDDSITGVAFVTSDCAGVTVKKIFHSDKCTYFRLLDAIKKEYPDLSMTVVRYPEEVDRKVIWSKNYKTRNLGGPSSDTYGEASGVYDVSSSAEMYGMIRFLRVSEILKFLTNVSADSKYSILVKPENEEKEWLFCRANGSDFSCEEMTEIAARVVMDKARPKSTVLTVTDLEKIICRRMEGNSLILEAFGIPRLPINMCLLLD